MFLCTGDAFALLQTLVKDCVEIWLYDSRRPRHQPSCSSAEYDAEEKTTMGMVVFWRLVDGVAGCGWAGLGRAGPASHKQGLYWID